MHQESLDLFERLFPGKPGLCKIKIEENEKDILDKLGKMIDNRQETIKQIEKLYNEDNLTVGAISEILGLNIIDTYKGLTSKKDLGLKCANGVFNEITNACEVLSKKPTLILDLLTIFSIHQLEIQDIIVKEFSLGVGQSTIDELRNIIYTNGFINKDGSLRLSKEGEQYVKYELTAEDIVNENELLKTIFSWVLANCKIVPCYKALDFNAIELNKLEACVGTDSLETFLLAHEQGRALFTDDERLRRFAIHDTVPMKNVVWSQGVIIYLYQKGKISLEDFSAAIVNMIQKNYKYVFIDYTILLEAIKKSKWLFSEPFISVAQVLENTNKDLVLIFVPVLLLTIWLEVLLETTRDEILTGVLEIIAKNTECDYILENLKNRIAFKSVGIGQNLNLLAENINNKIIKWESSRL